MTETEITDCKEIMTPKYIKLMVADRCHNVVSDILVLHNYNHSGYNFVCVKAIC